MFAAAAGRRLGVVVATGMNTELGRKARNGCCAAMP
jgi:magnesium-transporting ATPase (P-type)